MYARCHLCGQLDDAGQGRGICGALDPQHIALIPAEVDHESDQRDQRDEDAAGDDQHLTAREAPAGTGSGAGLGGHVPVGLSAITVLSHIVSWAIPESARKGVWKSYR